jgi:hypothetical protein
MPLVHKFRVILDSVEDVFRDVELIDSVKFLDLHKQILLAFNFDNSQMASFYMSNDNWDKGQEITLMKMDFDDGSSSLEMQDVTLKSLIKKKGQKLVYVYDFINMWCFFIEVLDVYISEENKDEFPRVTYVFGDKPEFSSKRLTTSPEDRKLMLQNIGKKSTETSKSRKNDIFDGFDDFDQYTGGDVDDEDDFDGFENLDQDSLTDDDDSASHKIDDED